MALSSKQQIPLLTVIAIAMIVLALLLMRPPADAPDPPPPGAAESSRESAEAPDRTADDADPARDGAAPVSEQDPATTPAGLLSVLAEVPDWSTLEAYQETISRSDFERLLTGVFTTGEAWRGYISLSDTAAHIHTGRPSPDDTLVLRFASGEPAPLPRHWRATRDLPPAPSGAPLSGLHIAIDPGHIGGEWARMEERWFVVGEGEPVREGDLTLQVALLLRPQLEELGATVSLVRETAEPVTQLRPESLDSLAQDAHSGQESPAALRKFTERLFYRTAEIRARAVLVNQTLKPDLVLCLHFNAEAWGDPASPTLVANTHLHLLLNGAYNDEEVALEDQRFAMLAKLLQRTHEEEALIGASVADAFAEISGLPPYQYLPESRNARPVADHPYLWARNLLANRLYDCPVIFMEPYVMNSVTDHARIQAGDYEGLRKFGEEMRPSIFREYASAVSAGLLRHYATRRPLSE
jgi:N-acetylmuramoyl-L-alanine amidase